MKDKQAARIKPHQAATPKIVLANGVNLDALRETSSWRGKMPEYSTYRRRGTADGGVLNSAGATQLRAYLESTLAEGGMLLFTALLAQADRGHWITNCEEISWPRELGLFPEDFRAACQKLAGYGLVCEEWRLVWQDDVSAQVLDLRLTIQGEFKGSQLMASIGVCPATEIDFWERFFAAALERSQGVFSSGAKQSTRYEVTDASTAGPLNEDYI